MKEVKRFLIFFNKTKIGPIILVILLVLAFKIILNYVLNGIFLDRYSDNIYDDGLAKSLTYVNFIEPYIAHYNLGNSYYKNREYESAITEYEKALKGFPPKYKECSIRINLVLAKIALIDKEHYKDEDQKENTLKILYECLEILYEDGCAHREDMNGHSQTAEKLKLEILKIIQELEMPEDQFNNENSEGSDSQQNSQNGSDDSNESENRDQEIQNEIDNMNSEDEQNSNKNSDLENKLDEFEEKAYEDYNSYDHNKDQFMNQKGSRTWQRE